MGLEILALGSLGLLPHLPTPIFFCPNRTYVYSRTLLYRNSLYRKTCYYGQALTFFVIQRKLLLVIPDMPNPNRTENLKTKKLYT